MTSPASSRPPGNPGDRHPHLGALLERWDLFALLLHDHHHKEDDYVWPLLREAGRSAGDDEAAAVLDAMEAEHATIDPLLAAVRERLDRLTRATDA